MRYFCSLILIILSILSAYADRRPVSPKLHVLYVMEQEDPQYGLLNLGNEELMTNIMQTVKWGLSYSMSTTYLAKKEFTSAALKKAITTLKTSPRDIIVLYYSGFGLMPANPRNKFANWKLRDVAKQGLSVDEVERWLVAKKVHLNLIIADCSAQRVENGRLVASVGLRPDLRKRVIKRLFLDNCGVVKMGSSLPSMPSWVNDSENQSVFTGAYSGAFSDLLLTSDPAMIPKITFNYLSQLTAGRMESKLYGMPYRQVPVLDIKSCKRSVQRTIAPPASDTLSEEEILNGLLNGIAMNKDSLQRAGLINQLLAYCTKEATVEVGRFFGMDGRSALAEWMAIENDAKQYGLKDYLSQTQLPFNRDKWQPAVAGAVRLKSIAIVEKSVNGSLPRQINRFKLREEWVEPFSFK